MKKSKVICVLGMHRSGTSATARIINMLGADIGTTNNLLDSSDSNPKGHWEHEGIVKIHDEILKALGCSWDNPNPLLINTNWWMQEEIQRYKLDIINIIKNEFLRSELWIIKDPRTSILLPLWQEIFAELDIESRFVICVRNPLDVHASLNKRNGFNKYKSLKLWYTYTLSTLYYTRNTPRILLHYDELLDKPADNIKKISGLDPLLDWNQNIDAIIPFLDKKLRNNSSTLQDLIIAAERQPEVTKLYKLLINSQDGIFDPIEQKITEHLSNYKLVTPYFAKPNVSFVIYNNNNVDDMLNCVSSINLNVDVDVSTYEIIIIDGFKLKDEERMLVTEKTMNIKLSFDVSKEAFIKSYKKSPRDEEELLVLIDSRVKITEMWFTKLQRKSRKLFAVDMPIINYSNKTLSHEDGGVWSVEEIRSYPQLKDRHDLKQELHFISSLCLVVRKDHLMELLYLERMIEENVKKLTLRYAKGRPIYIWGAGDGGKRTLELTNKLGLTVEGFIDSSQAKHGQQLNNYNIFSPHSVLLIADEKPFIIIGSVYSDEIVELLNLEGYTSKDYWINEEIL